MIVLLRVPCSFINARNGAVRVVNVCPAFARGGPRRNADVVTDVNPLKERISRWIQADGSDGLRGAYRIRRGAAGQNLAEQYLCPVLQRIALRTVVGNVDNVRTGVRTHP